MLDELAMTDETAALIEATIEMRFTFLSLSVLLYGWDIYYFI